MTDRELAIAIGQRLIGLEIRLACLQSILNYTRTQDGSPLDWKPILEDLEQSPSMLESSQLRTNQLYAQLPPATPDAEVIRRLQETVFLVD